MMQLGYILTKYTGGYKFTKSQEEIYHLFYKYNIKIFTKKENKPDALIQTIRIYSWFIGIELGIEKCAILKM